MLSNNVPHKAAIFSMGDYHYLRRGDTNTVQLYSETFFGNSQIDLLLIIQARIEVVSLPPTDTYPGPESHKENTLSQEAAVRIPCPRKPQ